MLKNPFINHRFIWLAGGEKAPDSPVSEETTPEFELEDTSYASDEDRTTAESREREEEAKKAIEKALGKLSPHELQLEAKKTNSIERARILMKNSDPLVRINLTKNYNIPRKEMAEVLTYLSEDSDIEVRCAVAGSGRTPETALTEMMMKNQDNTDVLIALAGNEMASPEKVLAVLARHSNPKIRAKVAGNRSTPREIIINELSYDKEYEVREAIAICYFPIPEEVLNRFLNDDDRIVRKAAEARLESMGKNIKRDNEDTIVANR